MEKGSCILIVTANKNETKALLDDNDFKYKTERSNDPNDVNFYNVGTYGYYHAVHFELVNQGSIRADAAQLSIATAIDVFHPAAVILVGIAFGKEFHDNHKGQNIGDVLISDMVADYISGKVKDGELKSDGFTTESGRQLLSTFKFYSNSWNHKINGEKANCEFGLILSGDNVVDDKSFKEKLFKRYPRFIGGEMEGRGAYSACRNRGVFEWIIIKAICDWADGTKSENKQRNQIIAAKSAVSLLNHIFTNKDSLSKLVRNDLHNKQNKKLRIAVDTGVMSNSYDLAGNIRERHFCSLNRNMYYEALWKNHYKGVVRDQVATGNVRELIDFFVLPSITVSNSDEITIPFSEKRFYKCLTAGSGLGKSTLLDSIVLSNIINDLYDIGSLVLSENSKQKFQDYKKIRTSLFGEESPYYFPVFIHSEAVNSSSYNSAINLAEASNIDGFEEMMSEADKEGKLLFLIDSLDEVESEKFNSFLSTIKDILSQFPNASAIFASRFLGKKYFPFECEYLHLTELKMDSVEKITHLMLSDKEASKLIARFKQNSYLCSLVKNPFMLMTILETKGERHLHHLLESIVNAIIDRRWDKHSYDISSEDIKLLLGYLSCKYIFEDRKSADIFEIRQAFINAKNDLKLYSANFNVPDRNMDIFLRTLSSQSGILNVINQHHVERYVFQDNLVMCWLSANYIDRILSESKEIVERQGNGGIWSNALWLDKFIRRFSPKNEMLTSNSVITLVITLVIISEANGQDLQKSILYYMIFKDATSLSSTEKNNIALGYKNIIENTFGENDITNRDDSDCYRLIKFMSAAQALNVD